MPLTAPANELLLGMTFVPVIRGGGGDVQRWHYGAEEFSRANLLSVSASSMPVSSIKHCRGLVVLLSVPMGLCSPMVCDGVACTAQHSGWCSWDKTSTKAVEQCLLHSVLDQGEMFALCQ